MSDSDEYLPSANSIESCDTSHSSSRGEMEVPSTAQPYEGEPRAWFLARGVYLKIRTKKFPLLNIEFAAFVFWFLWRNLC